MDARKVRALVVGLAVLALLPPFLGPYWVGLFTEIMIFAILAMSLDLLLGYTGLPSLGHAGTFGVAAYAVAVLSTTYGAGFLVTFGGAIVVGILVSAAFGLLVSHVRDVYFLMITLALGMVLWGLGYRWIPVTGGDNGIAGIPTLAAQTGLPIEIGVAFYLVTFAIAVVSGLSMLLIVESPFGYTLRGIRENEGRMKSLGFNTWLHCYLSYIIAGAFASVAGVMWAYYNSYVSPTYMELTASSELFLMVTLGGPGTLIGPAFGAGLIVLLKNVMSGLTERWLFVLGAVYIITILVAPQGLWNLGRGKRREVGE